MEKVLAPPAQVTVDDLRAWLARHNVDMRDVHRAAFICSIATGNRGPAHVYLSVERYLRDADGQKFLVREGGSRVPAMEQLLIPLRDLPPMAEAE